MKADRLVAALLFLQSRERVTVAQLAAELEVSARTARRDLQALAEAGVPVYSTSGRGGGWALVGGARTDLTGLTGREVRALFLELGTSAAGPDLRSALRKLTRAIPAPMRDDAVTAAGARLVDEVDWSRAASSGQAPHQAELERAILDGTQVRLGYAAPGRPVSERTVHPLGLASKAGSWYLVADTDRGLRTYRLSRITSVAATGEPVRRPEGFELATAWRAIAGRLEDRMLAAWVRGRAEPAVLPLLHRLFDGRLDVGAESGDGRVEIMVAGPSPQVLAAQLAGFGSRVEVLEPAEARQHLAILAGQLGALYGLVTR